MDQVIPTALVETTKLCGKCGLTKPLDEFNFKDRESGVRASQCRACMAQYQKGYWANKRRTELASYLDQVKDASDPRNFGATTRIEAVVRAMLTRFNGLDGFTGFWFDFIQFARTSGKDHLVQRSLEVLARFIEISDRNQASTSTPVDSPFSIEDIRETFKRLLVEALFKDQELGAAVLEATGWTVEPPAEPPADTPADADSFYMMIRPKIADALEQVADELC